MIQDDIKSYWKFTELPFATSLPTKEAFLSTPSKTTLDQLSYSIQQIGSVCFLDGPSGSGKSLILRKLYDDFPNGRVEPILLNLMQPIQNPGWLAGKIADYLEWDISEHSAISRLIDRLDAAVERNRQIVLLIDSAHQIKSEHALDEVAALLNLQSLSNPCLSIVFAGNQLETNLMKAIRPISDRITMVGKLRYLDYESTREYIQFRLDLAGVEDNIFHEPAMRLIHQSTEGNILKIDRVCSNALFKAFKSDSYEIKKNIILETVRELPNLVNKSDTSDSHEEPEKKRSSKGKKSQKDDENRSSENSFDSFLKDPKAWDPHKK